MYGAIACNPCLLSGKKHWEKFFGAVWRNDGIFKAILLTLYFSLHCDREFSHCIKISKLYSSCFLSPLYSFLPQGVCEDVRSFRSRFKPQISPFKLEKNQPLHSDIYNSTQIPSSLLRRLLAFDITNPTYLQAFHRWHFYCCSVISWDRNRILYG